MNDWSNLPLQCISDFIWDDRILMETFLLTRPVFNMIGSAVSMFCMFVNDSDYVDLWYLKYLFSKLLLMMFKSLSSPSYFMTYPVHCIDQAVNAVVYLYSYRRIFTGCFHGWADFHFVNRAMPLWMVVPSFNWISRTNSTFNPSRMKVYHNVKIKLMKILELRLR
jgi:hypothetical protein